ncbi:MAG: hypothetical protein NC299_10650 [Lachnospiraceae bacterium]|nr:hypothetical protein [Lachnospiraceae bacterium]
MKKKLVTCSQETTQKSGFLNKFEYILSTRFPRNGERQPTRPPFLIRPKANKARANRLDA